MNQAVLVIVDQVELRELVGKVLSRAGYQVTLAQSGEEGLALVSSTAVHCLVVDKVLHGMHGAEVMAQARALKPGLKVVLITAHPEPLALDDQRPDVSLTRPFANLQSIEEAVASALEGGVDPAAVTLTGRLVRALKPRRGP